MKTSFRILLNGGALALATTLTGCLDNTLDSVSIPSNVAWNQMVTGVASPYSDLQVLTIGDNITAGLVPQNSALFCGDPTNSLHSVLSADDECPAGYTSYGIRYIYMLSIALSRPAFQAGGIQLTSDTGGGTVESISFAVNASAELKVVAGLSEGTIPLPRTFTMTGGDYVLDNYTALVFAPHDANFVSATFGSDPEYPDVWCSASPSDEGNSGGYDGIGFNTATATAGSYNCGVPISLSLTPPYSSVGQCISASLEQNCKNQGLKGKARAACNSAQIGNCHAIFHVPSAHNPTP